MQIHRLRRQAAGPNSDQRSTGDFPHPANHASAGVSRVVAAATAPHGSMGPNGAVRAPVPRHTGVQQAPDRPEIRRSSGSTSSRYSSPLAATKLGCVTTVSRRAGRCCASSGGTTAPCSTLSPANTPAVRHFRSWCVASDFARQSPGSFRPHLTADAVGNLMTAPGANTWPPRGTTRDRLREELMAVGRGPGRVKLASDVIRRRSGLPVDDRGADASLA